MRRGSGLAAVTHYLPQNIMFLMLSGSARYLEPDLLAVTFHVKAFVGQLNFYSAFVQVFEREVLAAL